MHVPNENMDLCGIYVEDDDKATELSSFIPICLRRIFSARGRWPETATGVRKEVIKNDM